MSVNHKYTSKINRLHRLKFLASRSVRGYVVAQPGNKKVRPGVLKHVSLSKDPVYISRNSGSTIV